MGTSTFSGPVVSQAGFQTGTDVVIDAVTAATLTLDPAVNSGRITPLSRAAGMAVTLPAATGSQATYMLLVRTTFTSSATIKVANSTDVMNGLADVGGATAGAFGSAAADDTITMNGTTTGGLAGSYISITDIAPGIFIVRANLIGSGTPATPFSATV